MIYGSGTSEIGVDLPAARTENDVLIWNGNIWTSRNINEIMSSVANTYSGSTSIILNDTIFERAALTGDVTAAANDNVTTITEGAVTTAKLADNAVTAAKITDSAVTTSKLADSAITTAKLADNVVTTSKIADSAITIDKIAAAAIDSTKIKNNSISLANLRPGSMAGQTMQWNGTEWVLAQTASVIKKLTVEINTTDSVQSIFWQGFTDASSNQIEVMGIEPVISSTEGDIFINENLTISTSVKVVSGAIFYTLKIRNENIDPSKKFTVKSINIYYTCADTLNAVEAPVGGMFAGQ